MQRHQKKTAPVTFTNPPKRCQVVDLRTNDLQMLCIFQFLCHKSREHRMAYSEPSSQICEHDIIALGVPKTWNIAVERK